MSSRHYHNENDKLAAAWLRNLIAAGLIAPGDVDERSIADVKPDDLTAYAQCHFFAGIGGWSYALRLAGWPDDRPVWTGSCPCQPFSAAGKRKGNGDARHLWPEFHRLIGECRPATVFGEQVASKDGRLWLAGVRADLEALGYAVGAADLCAASVGAPHIRQRLWWVAHAKRGAAERHGHEMARASSGPKDQVGEQRLRHDTRDGGAVIGMADPDGRIAGNRGLQSGGEHGQWPQDDGAGERMADAEGEQHDRGGNARRGRGELADRRDIGGLGNAERRGCESGPEPSAGAPTNVTSSPSGSGSWWRGGQYVPCLDGKARRAEPGVFPLAHGVPNRVGRLRGYGNAIVPQVAAEFITAVMECQP